MNRTEYIISKLEIAKIEIDFSGDLITTELLKPSTQASVTEQGVTITSITVGTTGNAYTVQFVDPGVAQATTTFSKTGNAITVSLAHDGTSIVATATSLVADYDNADSDIKQTIVCTGSGTDPLIATAVLSLAGGVDNTVITCVDSSVLTPVDSIAKITNYPTTVNSSGIVELVFASGEENKTYRIDVTNDVDSGRRLHKRVYVSVLG